MLFDKGLPACGCSNTLKKMVAMVGHSLPIYKGIMDLVCMRLRDSEAPYCGVKEAAYCALRSQLLMALHDVNVNEITSKASAAVNHASLSLHHHVARCVCM
jgi:hypothetical protein